MALGLSAPSLEAKSIQLCNPYNAKLLLCYSSHYEYREDIRVVILHFRPYSWKALGGVEAWKFELKIRAAGVRGRRVVAN